MPVRCARSASAAVACAMCTAFNAGVSKPSCHSLSMGRTPCTATERAIASADSCRSMTMPASSSSASVATRANVALLTLSGACGAKTVEINGWPAYSSRTRSPSVKYSGADFGPGTAGFGDRQTDDYAHSLFAGGPGGLVRIVVPIPKTGDAGSKHLGDRRQDAVAHEFRAEELPLEGRNGRLLSAKQRRRRVRMRVDHSGHQQMRGPLDDRGGGVEVGRIRARQEIENSPVANHQGMILEDLAARGHGHYPTGLDA